jgi:hypothetical protein
MKWDIPFGESSKTRAMRKQERRLPHQRPVKPLPKRPLPKPGPQTAG